MRRRLLATAVVLLLAAASLSVSLALTQASAPSVSSFDGTTLQAFGSFTDPVTGNLVYGSISAYSYQQETRFPSPGGSDRAKSGRTGSGKVTVQTVNVWADIYSPTGDYLASGFGSGTPTTYAVARDLSSGTLAASLNVDVYDAFGTFVGTFPVVLEGDFTATGPLETSRDNFRFHVKSPRATYHYISTESRRTAGATGTLTAQGMTFPVVADYAEIGTINSKSMFSG